jgi:hypothetical protein
MVYYVYWFVCVFSTTLTSLVWITLVHGVCSFWCAVEFGALVFYWELFFLWSSGIWVIVFFCCYCCVFVWFCYQNNGFIKNDMAGFLPYHLKNWLVIIEMISPLNVL